MDSYSISYLTDHLKSVQGFQYSYAQKEFSLKCQPVDFEVTEPKMKLVYITYMYFLLKLIDLLDTVFFVLRKKTNQITFLHKYHHAGMVAGTFISCKFLTGRRISFAKRPLKHSQLILLLLFIYLFRESRHPPGTHQFVGACCHVHVLLPHRLQTRAETVVLVEEAHYASAVGKSL